MKIVTTLDGVTITDGVLDQVVAMKGPFAASGLDVLYLLKDGTLGDPYPTTLTDSSGNGRDATKEGGKTSPTTVAEGIEAASTAGVWYNLPSYFPDNMTVLAVGKFAPVSSSVPWLFSFGGVRGPCILGSDATLQTGVFGGVSPANTFYGVDDTTRANDDWFCLVISTNKTTKRLRMYLACEGTALTYDAINANIVDHIDEYRVLGTDLAFGVAAHGAEDVDGSKAALFACWGAEKTLTEMATYSEQAIRYVYEDRGVVVI